MLRMTAEEFASVTAKAQKAGCSREEYCRRVLGGSAVQEAPSADVLELLRLMRRIGGNINQLVARANVVGFVDVPQLQKDLAELRQAQRVIVAAYTKGA